MGQWLGQVMPMDDTVQCAPRHEDWGLNRVNDWQLALCWMPKECFLTGKKLWACHAYHGTRLITGPGDPIVDHYWVDRDEFIIWKLKGNYYGN